MTRTTDTDYPWVELTCGQICRQIKLVCGAYKDRFIVFRAGRRSIFIYDVQTQTHKFLPDRNISYVSKSTTLDGSLYIFELNNQIQRLSLSLSTSASTSASTSTSTSTSAGLEWEKVGSVLKFYPYDVVSEKKSIYLINHEFIYCYDTRTDNLTKTSQLPQEGINFSAAAIANKIYIIGGCNQVYDMVSTVQVFDIASQLWSNAPPLPKALSNTALTTVSNRWIIIVGGYIRYNNFENFEMNSQIYVFDTLSQQWSESPIQLVPPRVRHKCLTVGSQLVCIGGDDHSEHPCPMQAINIKHIIAGWKYELVKHFILMRKLIDENRATSFVTIKKQKNNASSKVYENTDKVIQAFFTNIGLDVFRNVLSFLI